MVSGVILCFVKMELNNSIFTINNLQFTIFTIVNWYFNKNRAGCGKMWRLGGEREAWTGSHLGGLSFQVFCLFVKIWKQIFIPRPSQSSFVRTCLMLSGPSLPTLPLPSLLQYLLLVSYRAEDKVGHFLNEQEIYLKLKESLLSPAACPGQLCQPRRSRGSCKHSWSRIPPTHWNWSKISKIHETYSMKAVQVAVAYSALRHLDPEVTKGLGARIHQTFGFRLWQICVFEKNIILEVIIICMICSSEMQ